MEPWGEGVVLGAPQLGVTPPGSPRGCEVWEKNRNSPRAKKSLMLQLQERLENVGLDMAGSRQEGRAPRCAPLPREPLPGGSEDPSRGQEATASFPSLSRGPVAHQLSCPKSPVSRAETAMNGNGNWNQRPEEGCRVTPRSY